MKFYTDNDSSVQFNEDVCTEVPGGPSLHVPCFEQSVQSLNWAMRMHNMCGGNDGDLRDHITHILVAGSSRPSLLALAIVFTSTTTQVLARMFVGLFGVCANTGIRAAVILILVAQSSHPVAHMCARTPHISLGFRDTAL